VRFVFIYINYN